MEIIRNVRMQLGLTWTSHPDASVLRIYTHIHTNTVLRARYSRETAMKKGARRTTPTADGRDGRNGGTTDGVYTAH